MKEATLPIGLRQVILQILHVAFATLRISITSVPKGMYKNIFDPIFAGHIAQLVEMLIQRMHPSIGKQTHEMHLLLLSRA